MSLVYALSASLGASGLQYFGGQVHLEGTYDTYNADVGVLPDNPPCNLGGMTYGFRFDRYADIYVMPPPSLAIADGGLQFRAYLGASTSTTGKPWLTLYGATDTTGSGQEVLRLQWSSTARQFGVYTHNTLRGVATVTPLSVGRWITIGIRMRDDTVNGYIEITYDGTTIYTYSGNTGGTLAWGPAHWNWDLSGGTGFSYMSCATWWDDPALDPFLTEPRWIGEMALVSTAAAWGFFPVGAASLWQAVDDPAATTLTYAETATFTSEVRFRASFSAVNPRWRPKTVDAVLVQAAYRGDTLLGKIQPTINDGAGSSIDGYAEYASSEVEGYMPSIFLTDATGTPWTATTVLAHQFGVKVG